VGKYGKTRKVPHSILQQFHDCRRVQCDVPIHETCSRARSFHFYKFFQRPMRTGLRRVAASGSSKRATKWVVQGALRILSQSRGSTRGWEGAKRIYNQSYIDLLLHCSMMDLGSGAIVCGHPMEARTTTETPLIMAQDSNFFRQVLPATGLILGLVLTTAWISFLGYEVARLVQAIL
jgi:hypothetical protein